MTKGSIDDLKRQKQKLIDEIIKLCEDFEHDWTEFKITSLYLMETDHAFDIDLEIKLK